MKSIRRGPCSCCVSLDWGWDGDSLRKSSWVAERCVVDLDDVPVLCKKCCGCNTWGQQHFSRVHGPVAPWLERSGDTAHPAVSEKSAENPVVYQDRYLTAPGIDHHPLGQGRQPNGRAVQPHQGLILLANIVGLLCRPKDVEAKWKKAGLNWQDVYARLLLA